MKPSRSRWGLYLLLLLLPGCPSDLDLVRTGMFIAPLSYLLSLGILYRLRQDWAWREPAALLRPLVVAVPAGVLVLSDLWLCFALRPGQLSTIFRLLSVLGVGILLLMGSALIAVTGIIWRIWFRYAPRASFEGAALLGAALFFGPGLALSHGLIKDPGIFDTLVLWTAAGTMYGGLFGGVVVILGLWIEAWWVRVTTRPLQ